MVYYYSLPQNGGERKKELKKVLDLISEIGYNIKVALIMIFEN
ncbi:hypothetical protein CHCC20348_0165 [Bacillus paralicheniformis]|nr:hypothetical protein CHCC20348_0165 [Bacillus paralicheniformis]